MTIKVLAIDGGGIRGIIPAQILFRVEQILKAKHNKDIKIGDYFDIVVGTSTGGILTVLYLSPDNYNAKTIVDFFMLNADKIFAKSLLYKIKSLFGLIRPRYESYNMLKITEKYFKDNKLSDLKKDCIITSYDTEQRDIYLFKQRKAIANNNDDFYLKDVITACTAAPTYFKPHLTSNLNNIKKSLIDGGVYAINPALSGYVEAKKLFEHSNIKLLSIGTGNYKRPLYYKNIKKYGIIKWLMPLIEILNHSSSVVNDYYLKYAFNLNDTNYLRINGNIPKTRSGLDKTNKENLEYLKEFGDTLFERFKYRLINFLD